MFEHMCKIVLFKIQMGEKDLRVYYPLTFYSRCVMVQSHISEERCSGSADLILYQEVSFEQWQK